MSPEERIRMLLEENAMLRGQLDSQQRSQAYSQAQSPEYQAFAKERGQAAMAEEFQQLEDYQRNGYYGGPRLMPYRNSKPNQYMKKERRPKKSGPVGLD
jgi:hypothetical protein